MSHIYFIGRREWNQLSPEARLDLMELVRLSNFTGVVIKQESLLARLKRWLRDNLPIKYAGEDDDLGGTKPSDPDDGVDSE